MAEGYKSVAMAVTGWQMAEGYKSVAVAVTG